MQRLFEMNSQPRSKASRRRQAQAGLSAVEYTIALIIIMVAFVGWLRLTSTSIKSSNFVKKSVDVENLAAIKAAELVKVAEEVAKNIPSGGQIGSIAPEAPIANYSDQLGELGNLLTATSTTPKPGTTAAENVPVFQRQWLIVRDDPNPGDISIYVSVSYFGAAGKVTRFAREVKTEPNSTYQLDSNTKGGITTK